MTGGMRETTITGRVLVLRGLPWPPSVNRYYRHVSLKGRHATLISREGRLFRNKVAEYCLINQTPTMTGQLDLSVYLEPPDKRIRDVDNSLKSLLDALQHAKVIENDSQIYRLEAIKAAPHKGGRVTVTIIPYVADL